jgi:aryl-alcohol dehydrogenase-like predicted oxidoreductase
MASEYAYLGKTGLKVSRFSLGTMTFGGTAVSQCDEATAHSLLDAYVAAGGNLIDCADIYQGGESERIVGRWLAAHPEQRSRIVLATKLRFPVAGAAAGPNDVGLSRGHIERALAASLERLGVSHIDLLQCHAWDEGTPLEETLRALGDAVASGRVRYTGWSNVTGWQLQKICDESRRLGVAPPASVQLQYSLLERTIELELVPVCIAEGVALLAWSPLKGGWLSGKHTRDAPAEASRVADAEKTGVVLQSHPSYSQKASDAHTWRVLDALRDAAAKTQAQEAQVALRWLLAKKYVTSVVLGAKSAAQLAANLSSKPLATEETAALDAASALPKPYPYEMIDRVNAARLR